MNAHIRRSVVFLVANTSCAAFALHESWWIAAGINIAAVIIHLTNIERATRGVA